MKDGDIAGLAVFQDPYAYIAVKKDGAKIKLLMVNNGNIISEQPYSGDSIYLKANASYNTGDAVFYYSNDSKNFRKLGEPLHMKFNLAMFTGNKFGLFNYATKLSGGYVDFDWFIMRPANQFENLDE